MRLAPRLLFTTFFLVLAWQLAQLFWLWLIPERFVAAPLSSVSASPIAMPAINFSLFGRESSMNAPSAAARARAQQIAQWQLLGVVIDDRHQLALISQASEGLHWVSAGQTLENGVEIVRVAAKSVDLLTADGVRSLSLVAASQPLLMPAMVLNSSAAPAASGLLSEARQRLQQNPMQAMQWMRMEPQWSNGQLTGLRVAPQPGQETLFQQLGLETGDVVISLNGQPLTNWMRNMADLPKVLEGSGAQVQVLRQGKTIELSVKWS